MTLFFRLHIDFISKQLSLLNREADNFNKQAIYISKINKINLYFVHFLHFVDFRTIVKPA